ncbi:MAG: ABC transporter ATP-binding protein [Nitrospinae bacterium]|nr:ABC transporter ATP-binding protein [Nitrospinota bacterium]
MSDIVIADLCKEYRVGRECLKILKGVSLNVSKGETLGIVGVSGAGKSTLLHIMGGLDKPTSGRVLFADKDIFAQNDVKLANFRNARIGFVFQFHNLLPEFTALENVAMPRLIAREERGKAEKRATELLEKVGLGERLRHKPGELSGGEQQRVAIARAMSNSPEVILADEPTGNLDTHTGEMVFQKLLDLRRQTGCTLIIITHNEGIAARMQRTIRLEDGRVVEETRHC